MSPYNFCPLLCPSLHEMFPGISNFLEEISSLSHSIVFLHFFALVTEEGFLISPCYSLELLFRFFFSLLHQLLMCAKSFQLYPTLQPCGLQPTRLLCQWDSPDNNTGVGFQGFVKSIFDYLFFIGFYDSCIMYFEAHY